MNATPYTRLLNQITVTEENLEEARAACVAIDQARELVPGSKTWGIIYEGGQRGQMSRYPDDSGAICLGGQSIWGWWIDSHDPTDPCVADMLQTDDGHYYGEHGQEMDQSGYPLTGPYSVSGL
jgi:hypothetical protein